MHPDTITDQVAACQQRMGLATRVPHKGLITRVPHKPAYGQRMPLISVSCAFDPMNKSSSLRNVRCLCVLFFSPLSTSFVFHALAYATLCGACMCDYALYCVYTNIGEVGWVPPSAILKALSHECRILAHTPTYEKWITLNAWKTNDVDKKLRRTITRTSNANYLMMSVQSKNQTGVKRILKDINGWQKNALVSDALAMRDSSDMAFSKISYTIESSLYRHITK